MTNPTTSYAVTHHNNHIQVVIHDNFDVHQEAHTVADALYNALEERDRKTFITIEVGNLKWNFADIMTAVNLSAKGGHAYLRHKNFQELILITEVKALEIVLRSLDTPMFGNVKSSASASYEQAVTYIQQHA